MTRNMTVPAPVRRSPLTPTWLALPVLLGLAALATPARAQYAPMGGSNAMIDRMVGLQQLGNRMAVGTAWQAYRMMQEYRRRTGFTGQFQPLVTPQQQAQSAASLSRAYDALRRSGAYSSQSRAAAAENFSLHGILGQQTMVNPATGNYSYFVPNNYNHWYATPQGRIGTNSETYQPWGSTELVPAR
jgi:hypothetical protein